MANLPDDDQKLRTCYFCKGSRNKVILPVGNSGVPMCLQCSTNTRERTRDFDDSATVIASAMAIVKSFDRAIQRENGGA